MPARKTARKTATRGRKPGHKTATRKTAVRKTIARKTVTKRKTTRKKIAAKKATPKKLASVSKAFTKGEVMTRIASMTDLSRKEVSAVFESLQNIIEGHLRKRGGVGEFTLPGLLKCRVVKKPATKARIGINPFTGEEATFKAKPARNVVKIRPLKKLKEMVK